MQEILKINPAGLSNPASVIIEDVTKFEFQCGSTWLEPESRKVSTRSVVDVSKLIISNILADLSIEESRVLCLDAYAKLIKEHQLARGLMEQLVNEYPHLLKNVRYIHFENCLSSDEKECSAFFNMLFDKNNFPALSCKPSLFIKYPEHIALLHQHGIDLTEVDVLADMFDTCRDVSSFQKVIEHYQKLKKPLTVENMPLLKAALVYQGYYVGQPYAVAALLQAGIKEGLDEGLKNAPNHSAQKGFPTLAHWAATHCNNMGDLILMIECCIQENLPLDQEDANHQTPLQILEANYANLQLPIRKYMKEFFERTLEAWKLHNPSLERCRLM